MPSRVVLCCVLVVVLSLAGCGSGNDSGSEKGGSSKVAPTGDGIPSDVKYAPGSRVLFSAPGSAVVYQRVQWIHDNGTPRGYCLSASAGGRALGVNCYELGQVRRLNAIQSLRAPDGKFDVAGLTPSSAGAVKVRAPGQTENVSVTDGYFVTRMDSNPKSYSVVER